MKSRRLILGCPHESFPQSTVFAPLINFPGRHEFVITGEHRQAVKRQLSAARAAGDFCVNFA
jgi:hypothetical protein